MTIETQISDQLDDDRWDEFVAKNRYCQHEQTSGFAHSRKKDYEIFRILLVEDEVIVGGAQILVMSTRVGGIAEIRHGPLFARDDVELVRTFVDSLKDEASKKSLAKVEILGMGANQFLEQSLRQFDFQSESALPEISNSSLGWTSIIDLRPEEDEILSRMKRKTRYNVRYAQKKGITVDYGDVSDLDDFYTTLKQTSDSKRFAVYPIEFYYYLWDLFSRENKIHVLVAKAGETPQATLILVPFGDRLCRMWSSSVRSKPDYKATYLLDWEAIKLAKSMGFREYDLCGIGHEEITPTCEYKKSLGGSDHRYPDTLESYFGMCPELKRRVSTVFGKTNMLRKVAEKLANRKQPILPY